MNTKITKITTIRPHESRVSIKALITGNFKLVTTVVHDFMTDRYAGVLSVELPEGNTAVIASTSMSLDTEEEAKGVMEKYKQYVADNPFAYYAFDTVEQLSIATTKEKEEDVRGGNISDSPDLRE